MSITSAPHFGAVASNFSVASGNDIDVLCIALMVVPSKRGTCQDMVLKTAGS